MWGNSPKPKEADKLATAPVFTAEVNGVKLSAPSQEALLAMIPTVQAAKPAAALESEPVAGAQPVVQQPAQQPGQPQVTKWTLEQFQQAMSSGDIHGAIMSIVGQSLGLKDFAGHMGQMSRAIEGVYNFSHNNMIGAALTAAGAEPTAANVMKFTQLMGTRPQTEQQPTMENYAKFAEHVTAPERQWIAKVAPPQPAPGQLGPDGKPLPQVDPVTGAPVAPGAAVMPTAAPAPGAPVAGVQPAPANPAAALAPAYATNVAGPQAVVESQFPTRAVPNEPLDNMLMGQQPGEGGDSEATAAAEGLPLAELEQNLAEASAMPAPAQAG